MESTICKDAVWFVPDFGGEPRSKRGLRLEFLHSGQGECYVKISAYWRKQVSVNRYCLQVEDLTSVFARDHPHLATEMGLMSSGDIRGHEEEQLFYRLLHQLVPDTIARDYLPERYAHHGERWSAWHRRRRITKEQGVN